METHCTPFVSKINWAWTRDVLDLLKSTLIDLRFIDFPTTATRSNKFSLIMNFLIVYSLITFSWRDSFPHLSASHGTINDDALKCIHMSWQTVLKLNYSIIQFYRK